MIPTVRSAHPILSRKSDPPGMSGSMRIQSSGAWCECDCALICNCFPHDYDSARKRCHANYLVVRNWKRTPGLGARQRHDRWSVISRSCIECDQDVGNEVGRDVRARTAPRTSRLVAAADSAASDATSFESFMVLSELDFGEPRALFGSRINITLRGSANVSAIL
jgi:hypothetical protein